VTFAAETTQTNRTRREFNSLWRIYSNRFAYWIDSNRLFPALLWSHCVFIFCPRCIY